jgi:hypothetical protein
MTTPAQLPSDISLPTWKISMTHDGIRFAHRGIILWDEASAEIELADVSLLKARDEQIEAKILRRDFGDGLLMRYEFFEADG